MKYGRVFLYCPQDPMVTRLQESYIPTFLLDVPSITVETKEGAIEAAPFAITSAKQCEYTSEVRVRWQPARSFCAGQSYRLPI